MNLDRTSPAGRWLVPRPVRGLDEARGPSADCSLQRGREIHDRLRSSALALWPRLDRSDAPLSEDGERALRETLLDPGRLGPFRLVLAPGASAQYEVESFFRPRASFFQGRRRLEPPGGAPSVVIDSKGMGLIYLLSQGPRTWDELRAALCQRDPGVSEADATARLRQLLAEGFVEVDHPAPDARAWQQTLAGDQNADLEARIEAAVHAPPRYSETGEPPDDLPPSAALVEARVRRMRLRRELSLRLLHEGRLAELLRDAQSLLGIPGSADRMELGDLLRGLAAWWSLEQNPTDFDAPPPPDAGSPEPPAAARTGPDPQPPGFRLVRDDSGTWTLWEKELGNEDRARMLRIRGREVWEEAPDGGLGLPVRCLSWFDLLLDRPHAGLRLRPAPETEGLRSTPPAAVVSPVTELPPELRPPSPDSPATILLDYGAALSRALDLGSLVVFDRLPPHPTVRDLCADLRAPASVRALLHWWQEHEKLPIRVRPLPCHGTFDPGKEED